MERPKEGQVVGIDVAKEWLDVAVHPSGEQWRVTQDSEGLAGLVQRLAVLAPAPPFRRAKAIA